MSKSLFEKILDRAADHARKERRKKPKRPPARPTPTPEPVPSGPTEGGACMAACAEAQVGDRYVWGTAGPHTFDCSGLVAYCYEYCTGKSLARSSHEQAKLGYLAPAPLEPGDILVYGGGAHVGIVTGENRAVHALNETRGVIVAQIPGTMGMSFDGARRLSLPGKPVPQPTPPKPAPEPVPTPSRLGSLTGTVRTPRPGSSTPYGIPWSNVSRYAGIFERQGARAGVDPLLLAAMAIVESDATHHRANGQVVVRGSDGYDNHPAVGMMQVKPAYHQWRDPGADAYTPEGNVRLAALIIADGIKQYGTWERALTTLYFPGDDVNGTTQGGYVATVRALMKEMGSTQEPAPTPAPERTTYVAHTLPGTNETFWLPHWIRFRERLTPPGPNRQQHPMRPTVTVFHTTNNNNPSTGAWHHADRWQAQGTPGHPDGKVGVHAYVDAKEVVWTIPINEKGVHSGDWRNDWGIAIERTTNSDQDQVEAENNAMHVHAGLLHVLGKTARDAMYPHTHNAEGHCPRLTRPWSEVERIVDERIKRIAKEDV